MAHSPTVETREFIRSGFASGVCQPELAQALGVSVNTLKKHYSEELKGGLIAANVAVAGALYRAAMEGNTTAQIFWLKTRAGWREKQDLNITSEGESFMPTVIQLVAPDHS